MISSLAISHSSLRPGVPRRKAGFTLIELLVVIGVVSILGTITIGTSRMLVQTSRERRTKVTRDALNVALHRYRTEYQQWPVSKSDKNWDSHSTREGTTAYNGYEWYEWKSNNDRVFGALRKNDRDNPDNIRFIDETAVYTRDSSGKKVVPLANAGSGNHALCYAMKRDNKPEPYIVWICFDTDEAEVGPRDGNFKTGESDDDDAKYGY